MAIYYVDFENGTDTQMGGAPVKKIGCAVTLGSSTLTVPSNSGLISGMKVLSTDLDNSGGLFASSTTISSISGTTITLSANAVATNASATVIFSPAKKTISSLTSLLNSGDVVRVKQSPEPESTTISTTWTSGSSEVAGTFPIKIIDNCETAFTAGPFPMVSVTSASCVQGTKSCAFGSSNPVSNILYGYRQVSLDLSGYSRVSMMVWCPARSGQMKFNLCSDTVGQVPVYSGVVDFTSILADYNMQNIYGFYPAVIDMGQDMTVPINSISFQMVNSAGGAYASLTVDNIVACKAASDPTAITHKSLLSKASSGEEWYAIRSLSPTSIDLYIDPTTGYSKPSHTGTLYKREATYVPPNLTGNSVTAFSLTSTGTESAPITISGGWDKVDMSTQPSTTILQENKSLDAAGPAVFTLAGGYTVIERLGAVFGYFSITATKTVVIKDGIYIFGPAAASWTLASSSAGAINLRSTSGTGKVKISNCYCVFTTIGNTSSPAPSVMVLVPSSITAINSCSIEKSVLANGGYLADTPKLKLSAYSSFFSARNLWYSDYSAKDFTFSDCTFRKASLSSGNSYHSNKQIYRNCSFDFLDNTSGKISSWPTATSPQYPDTEVRFDKFNQVANDHRIYKPGGIIQSHSGSYRHTASGISWALSPTSTSIVDSYSPLTLSLAKVAVTSGSSSTISAWVYRTGSDVVSGIRLKAGDILGLSEQKVSVTAVGSWEQISITFTPPADGIVEVEAFAYGTSTNTAYFDDLTASQ